MRVLLALGLGGCVLWPSVGLSQEPNWQLESESALSAGDGVGPGHDLLFVSDAALLADGSLVVISGGTHDVRHFAADGTHLRTIGREGEGPGEFEAPGGLQVLSSGEVLVYDQGNLRLTRFSPEWEVLSTLRVEDGVHTAGPTPAFGRRRPLVSGWVPTARFEVPLLESVRRAEGVYRDELVISVVDGEQVRGTIRAQRGAVYHAREGSSGVTLPLPMGEFVLFSWNANRIVVGSSHSPAFELFDGEGRSVGVAEAQGTPRRATRQDMQAYDVRLRAEWSESTVTVRGVPRGSQSQVDRFIRDAPRGDRVPLFDEVHIEGDRIWVREYVLHTAVATWQVVDPVGGVVARLRLPADAELLRATKDYVLLLERDEYDVELVRAYRVVR